MQFANVMLALGGDAGTTVPKYDVTASEIAVLRTIHGEQAVFDVEPTREEKRSDREEISRLREVYGHARVQTEYGERSVVEYLFPGGAARAYQSVDDLDLPEELYKAETRVASSPRKGKKGKAAEPEAEQPADDSDKPTAGAEDPLFS